MTKILTQTSAGVLVEVEHTSATTALVCASDGSLTEIAASGTQKVVALDANGVLGEVSVTFGSFTGAADSVTGKYAVYSTRRLLTAYTGPLIRVRRSSDSAEQDIGYVSNGDLDTDALTTFVGANSGYLVKWYDQSGNVRDLTPINSANVARVVNAGTVETVNSRACIKCTAANQMYRHTLDANFNSQTSELFSVWSNVSVANARFLSFNPTGGTDWSSVGGWAPCGANDVYTNRINYAYYNGTAELPCAVRELATCYSNRTADTYVFIAKGAYTANKLGRPPVNSNYINLGTSDGTAQYAANGYWCEGVVTNAIQSDYTSFWNNQKTYWGTS